MVDAWVGPAARRGGRAPFGALWALLACTAATQALAAAPEAAADDASPAASAPQSDTDEMLEATRRTVRSSAEWLARGVDSWFGDKPFTEGGKVTDGRLSMHLVERQHERADFGIRFNARFRLPNVEEHTYLFIGRDNQRELVTDKPGALSRQEQLLTETNADRSFFAGFGRALNDAVDFRLGLRGPLKPYAQARYRRPWQLGPRDLAEFRETLFWTIDDHVGSTTAVSFEHAVSSTLALRWLSAATITQVTPKFDWNTSLGAYQTFGAQRLLSMEALFSGLQGSGVGVSDYGLQLKWQQPLHRDWLIGEIIVGHFWTRVDATSPRLPEWAAGGSLQLRF